MSIEAAVAVWLVVAARSFTLFAFSFHSMIGRALTGGSFEVDSMSTSIVARLSRCRAWECSHSQAREPIGLPTEKNAWKRPRTALSSARSLELAEPSFRSYREDICYPKGHLLTTLLRHYGIPTDICYQRLTLLGDDSAGYAIHALNALYLEGARYRSMLEETRKELTPYLSVKRVGTFTCADSCVAQRIES